MKDNGRFYLNYIIATLFALGLVFVSGLTTQDVNAAQPDWYTKGKIEKHVNRSNANNYYLDGYFYYQSYYTDANPSVYYEGGAGRWSDAHPRDIRSSLYNPEDIEGKRELSGRATDWGFSPQDTYWAGSKGYDYNGTAYAPTMRYFRYTRVRYKRAKTTPSTRGIDQVSGVYAKGSNYWVAPNDTVQIRVRGYQTWNGYGKNIQLDDYVGSNNLRLVGGDQDIRSSMSRDGRINNFRTDSDAKISKHSSSVSSDKRTLFSKFNVVAKRGAYNIHTYATSENGKKQGYVDTGKDLRVDASAPDRKDVSVYDARYVDGKNHWYKSGDSFRVRLVGFDKESEMRNTNLRLYGDGNDNRAVHFWDQHDGYVNEFNSGEYTDITSGTSPYLGWTAEYIFGGKIHSNIGNRTFQVQDFFEDNVRNSIGYTDTGLRIKTDDSAPSANRVWIDNVTQDDFYVYIDGVTDGQSGVKEVRFPTWTNADGQDDLNKSWKTSSSAVGENRGNGVWRYKVERSEHNWEFGKYIIHPYVYDNVGNQKSYSISYTLRDTVKPEISVSLNPTDWTRGNVTATITAKDTHTGVKSITMPDGTVVAQNGGKGETVTDTYTITSNGTYTFKATDAYNNVVSQTVTVSNIDKIVPSGSVSQSPTNWTNGNVTLTASVGDNESGYYRTRLPDGSYTTSTKPTYTVSANGTYSFVVYDNVGNTRTLTKTVTNIDKVKPDIQISPSTTRWTNDSITLTATVNDAGSQNRISGVQQVRMRKQGGSWGSWQAFDGSTEHKSSSFTKSWSVSTIGTYEFEVQDRAGNSTTTSYTVENIDKTIPSGSIDRYIGWTNGNVWIDVTGRDTDSGLAKIEYVSGGKLTGASYYTFTGTTSAQTKRFIATENGTYRFRITDRAGNSVEVTREVSNIDRTAPSVKVDQDMSWTNKDVELTVSMTDSNRQGSRISGIYDVYMKRDDGTKTGKYPIANSEETTKTFKQTFTAEKNGTYTFVLRDRAGNIKEVSQTVTNIDRTKPTGQLRIVSDFKKTEVRDGSIVELDMIEDLSTRVQVLVQDLGAARSGVESVVIEEQSRTSIDGTWKTIREHTVDWSGKAEDNWVNLDFDINHALDTRFVLTAYDRAGNSSDMATSNSVRHSVLNFIDFKITDVVNPELTADEIEAIRESDLTSESAPLTAGTNATFDFTYELRHLDEVVSLSGKITVKTNSPNGENIQTTVIQVDEPLTGHNKPVTLTESFKVPEGAPKGSTVNIYGDLVAKMKNGAEHKIVYPNAGDIGVIDNQFEEFLRFRIVR